MGFLINQGLNLVGRKLGKSMFNDILNVPEAYADRIGQDFGNEWHDAYEIYRQNPGFWEDAYGKDAQELKGGPKMAPVSRTSDCQKRLPQKHLSMKCSPTVVAFGKACSPADPRCERRKADGVSSPRCQLLFAKTRG